MGEKPTYEELEQVVKELEKEAADHKGFEEQVFVANERLQYLLSFQSEY